MQHNHSLKEWMISSSPSPCVLVLDGGVSTYLEKMCGKFEHRCLWSSSLLLTENGQRNIQKCHQEFLKSGSDILSTITYQLSHYLPKKESQNTIDDNISKLCCSSSTNLDDKEIDDLLGKGLELAQYAKRQYLLQETTKYPRYVMGSIGCYGASLADGSEYTGQYGKISLNELVQFHRRRFQLFWKWNKYDNDQTTQHSMLDAIAFETVPSLLEIRAILTLLKEEIENDQEIPNGSSPNKHSAIWISLACKDGIHLNDGSLFNSALDLIQTLDPYGKLVHGIGVNCCSLKYTHNLVSMMARHHLQNAPKARRALIFYPNSGEQWDAQNEQWLQGSGCTNPKEYTNEMVRCIQTIHQICQQHIQSQRYIPIIVGGCCRTSTDMISELRGRVDKEFLTK